MHTKKTMATIKKEFVGKSTRQTPLAHDTGKRNGRNYTASKEIQEFVDCAKRLFRSSDRLMDAMASMSGNAADMIACYSEKERELQGILKGFLVSSIYRELTQYKR